MQLEGQFGTHRCSPTLLDPGPARHVNEILPSDNVIDEAHDEGGCVGRCWDFLRHCNFHKVLNAVHNLQNRQKTIRISCSSLRSTSKSLLNKSFLLRNSDTGNL